MRFREIVGSGAVFGSRSLTFGNGCGRLAERSRRFGNGCERLMNRCRCLGNGGQRLGNGRRRLGNGCENFGGAGRGRFCPLRIRGVAKGATAVACLIFIISVRWLNHALWKSSEGFSVSQ